MQVTLKEYSFKGKKKSTAKMKNLDLLFITKNTHKDIFDI